MSGDPVVDDDDPVVCVGLTEDGLDRLADEGRGHEGGNDDGDGAFYHLCASRSECDRPLVLPERQHPEGIELVLHGLASLQSTKQSLDNRRIRPFPEGRQKQ